jgi:hypothetical protein
VRRGSVAARFHIPAESRVACEAMFRFSEQVTLI